MKANIPQPVIERVLTLLDARADLFGVPPDTGTVIQDLAALNLDKVHQVNDEHLIWSLYRLFRPAVVKALHSLP